MNPRFLRDNKVFMEEPTKQKKSSGDFKTFFLRGLAIVLPTVLTIWLIVIAYAFVSQKIAQPINAGLREVVLRFTDWPPPQEDDFQHVFNEELTPLQQDSWEHYEERREVELGIPRLRGDRLRSERRAWMEEDPALFLEARRIAFRNHWESYRIGAWRVLDVIGLIIAIILIYIAGLLVTSFLGRRFYRLGENLIGRVPLIRNVYPAMKQITDFFFGDDADKIQFNRVVAVQYPRKGLWSVGLVTGDTMRYIEDAAGEICLTVFVPSSPTPFTGYVITVPKRDTIDLPINIEDALKFAVSGGVVIPHSQTINRNGDATALPGQTTEPDTTTQSPHPQH